MGALGSDAMKRRALIATALWASATSLAHVRQRSWVAEDSKASSGKESILRWDMSAPPKITMHQFSGTLGSSSTLTFSDARNAMGTSFGKWTASFGGVAAAIALDLTGGNPYVGASTCETATDGSLDTLNNIVFTSQVSSTCASPIPQNSGVIGITRARYNASTGQIIEADIQFDDRSFRFTNSGTNDLASSPKVINLNDVAVHEMGHFFGLDHTAVRNATMLFAVAEDLQTPKSDDMMGVFSIYAPTNKSTLSTLKGSLTDESGLPIFGAVVFAIDARTLKISATEMTDVNGAFEFCTLPTGPHVFYASRYLPYGGNIHAYYSGDGSSTSPFYESDGTEFCYNPACTLMASDAGFKRSWLVDSLQTAGAVGGADLRIYSMPAGGASGFLNLTLNTSDPSLPDAPATGASAGYLDLDRPRLARLTQSNLGLTDQVLTDVDVYKITLSAATDLAVNAASLGLYARLQLKVEVYDDASLATKRTCTASPAEEAVVLQGTDPGIVCSSVPAGTYYVKVTAKQVACSKIPGNTPTCASTGKEDASTSIPFYILTAFNSATSAESLATASLSGTSNAGSTYKNLPTCTELSTTATTDSSGDSGGCCGSLDDRGFGGPTELRDLMARSLMLSPLLWFAIAWAFVRGLNQIKKRPGLKST
jgi:hypothetical protein